MVQIDGPTGAFIVVVAGVFTQFGFDGLLLATLLAGISAPLAWAQDVRGTSENHVRDKVIGLRG